MPFKSFTNSTKRAVTADGSRSPSWCGRDFSIGLWREEFWMLPVPGFYSCLG